ncbi:MAG TPA: hypothetical protein VF188_01940 [Longimicrobiales bacterium]
MRAGRRFRTWRQFSRRDRGAIHAQLLEGPGRGVRCPRCGRPLAAQPGTRFAAILPGDVAGFDLDCRACHQFHPCIRHTPRSLYLLRLHRLAAAVRRA